MMATKVLIFRGNNILKVKMIKLNTNSNSEITDYFELPRCRHRVEQYLHNGNRRLLQKIPVEQPIGKRSKRKKMALR